MRYNEARSQLNDVVVTEEIFVAVSWVTNTDDAAAVSLCGCQCSFYHAAPSQLVSNRHSCCWLDAAIN